MTESRSSWDIGRIRRTPYAAPRLGVLLGGRGRLCGRGRRRPRLGHFGGALGELVLVLAGDRVLELAHSTSHRSAEIRQALRTKNDQDDHKDDHDLERAWSPHGLTDGSRC